MSEPSVPIERIRQPLTAIVGRLDMIVSVLNSRQLSAETMVALIQGDISAAQIAATQLTEMCKKAERGPRTPTLVITPDRRMEEDWPNPSGGMEGP